MTDFVVGHGYAGAGLGVEEVERTRYLGSRERHEAWGQVGRRGGAWGIEVPVL